MPFNTRNPIPSGDLRDLDDNARNIDTWANDKTKLSHPDRFGVQRRTWHGIEQEAKLNIQQAIDAKNAAQEAAMMSGFSKYADTLAQLEAGIGTDYVEGDVVMVFQDESRGDTSSIFKIESGSAEFKLTFDKTRQDLLSFTGNISADAEWSDVPAHSDPAFDSQAQALANRTELLMNGIGAYSKIREYSGNGARLNVQDPTGVHWWARRGSAADNGGTVLVDALGRSWEREFSGAINPRWFESISAAIKSADGSVIDFAGAPIEITEPFSVVLNENTTINNANFIFNAESPAHYSVRISHAKDLRINNFQIDGQNLTPQPLKIDPNSTDARVFVDGFDAKNALQTDIVTSSAAGLYISPVDTEETFQMADLRNIIVRNVDSTKADTGSLSTVGRGVYVWGAKLTTIDGFEIDNVGPYQDGDGISISASQATRNECTAIISNGKFKDCAKRSIKSQVSNPRVSNIVCERTRPFIDNGSGQTEVDLQQGGVFEGGTFIYASGSAPRTIVSISAYGDLRFADSPGHAKDITVKCDNPNDVIESIVGVFLNDAGGDFSRVEFSGIRCNAKVRNIAKAYNRQSDLVDRTISELVLHDCKVGGFASDANAAHVLITRGSASVFNVGIKLIDIESANVVPCYMLDTAPGTTSFLRPTVIEIAKTKVSDPNTARSVGDPAGLYRFVCAENASLEKIFTLAHNASAVVVTVTYTSARDNLEAKLITQGVIQSAPSKTFYTELLAGRKTNTQAGTISIESNASSNTFSVKHLPGSTSSTGFLCISVNDDSYISKIE